VPSFHRILALLPAALAASVMAQEQVRFTGTTTAGQQLIHDAFQNIAIYIRGSLKCNTIEEVVAEVLPDGTVKRDASQPEGIEPATYERWTVSYCGKKRSFVVVFWDAKEGGTMYRVQLDPGADS